MAAVVRIKNNRFVKVNLQNKDARLFSFGQIDKPGVLDGYIKAVVHTAYPVFQSNYYGKLRKIILVETRDEDDDDDDECHKFSFFTRGAVAEKCAEIKEGDVLLLEMPFFELSHPKKAVFQIVGDKKCSDICIWIVNKKSRLLVGLEEGNVFEESDFESVDDTADHGDLSKDIRIQKDDQDCAMDESDSEDAIALPVNQVTPSNVNRSARDKSNVVKSVRNSASRENNISKKSVTPIENKVQKSQRNSRGTASSNEDIPRKSPRFTKDITSRENDDVPESTRVTRSIASKKGNIPIQSPRVTRNNSSIAVDTTIESTRNRRKKNLENVNDLGKKKDKVSSSSSEAEKPQTRSASSKSTEKGNITPPPIKRKRKFHLGPKGSSSSPNESPEIRNVVALEVQPKKTLRKENEPQIVKTRVVEELDPIEGPSVTVERCQRQRKVPHSSKSPKPIASTVTDEELSQENNGYQTEIQTNSQASTPSGTFSSKRGKYIGNCLQSDSSPGTPNQKLPPKVKKVVTATQPRAINNHSTDAVAGSSTEVDKDATNSNQPNNIGSAVITFVDDNQVVLENINNSQTGSQSGEESAKVAKNKAKSNEPDRNRNAADVQPSTSEQSTSTTSSNVPVPQIGPNVMQQSPSTDLYSIPVNYTKISDVKVNTACNLYGVAKFFKPPWRSRGTDMCSVVVLADPSSDEPLECVMFKDVVLLPQIRRVGDIVRLHRMNIKQYKDKLQAVSTKGFSALVFDHNVGIPVTKESARVSTGSFSFDEAEKKVVQSLKEWRMSKPDLFEKAKFLTVSMVEPDLYFDIVCQVIGMSKHTTIDCVVLRVTDGTVPEHEIKSCEGDDSYQVILPTDSQNKSPTFDVFLYGEHASLVINLDVKVGTLLLLHNVHSIVTQGGPGASLLDVLEPTLELCVHRGSEYGRGLAVLTPDASDTRDLLKRLKQQSSSSP